MILIWDRLNVHRSKKLQLWRSRYPRLTIEYLPPYAPELNAIEYLWGHTKNHKLANHGFSDLDDLHREARTAIEDTAGQQQLLRSFVHASGLPIRFRL